MSIGAAEHQCVLHTHQPPLLPGHHQGHQVAEAAAAGGHPTGLSAKTQTFGHPGTEAALEPRQAGRQLFRQQIVIQAGADQIGGHRSRERGRIQMGHRTRMHRIEGPIHHQLEIIKQSQRLQAIRGRCHLRQHAEQG